MKVVLVKVLIWISDECNSLFEVVDGIKKSGNEVGLLLVQDGVFQADKGNPCSKGVMKLGVPVYAARPHVQERGLEGRLTPGVSLVDFGDMVDLAMDKYEMIVSL